MISSASSQVSVTSSQ
jgi:tRNA nucleotidyltransferase/poly(A) polymerase